MIKKSKELKIGFIGNGYVGMYEKILSEDKKGVASMRAMEEKNLELLISTNKTMDIVRAVYADVPAPKRPSSTRTKKRAIARPH
jgi:hypothetical protein